MIFHVFPTNYLLIEGESYPFKSRFTIFWEWNFTGIARLLNSGWHRLSHAVRCKSIPKVWFHAAIYVKTASSHHNFSSSHESSTTNRMRIQCIPSYTSQWCSFDLASKMVLNCGDIVEELTYICILNLGLEFPGDRSEVQGRWCQLERSLRLYGHADLTKVNWVASKMSR